MFVHHFSNSITIAMKSVTFLWKKKVKLSYLIRQLCLYILCLYVHVCGVCVCVGKVLVSIRGHNLKWSCSHYSYMSTMSLHVPSSTSVLSSCLFMRGVARFVNVSFWARARLLELPRNKEQLFAICNTIIFTSNPLDRLSVAAAVVFSILGAIIVAAVIVIIIGVVHKH